MRFQRSDGVVIDIGEQNDEVLVRISFNRTPDLENDVREALSEFGGQEVLFATGGYLGIVITAASGAVAEQLVRLVAVRIRAMIARRKAGEGEEWREDDGYL